MSGSNPVYQPTTVSYDRDRDGFEHVYVPTFARQSQARRLLPTALFVGGIMVGILALSFIIIGSSSGGSHTDPLPQNITVTTVRAVTETGNSTEIVTTTPTTTDVADTTPKAVLESNPDGSNVLVGVGIPMLLIAAGMILFAMRLRGYLDTCIPRKGQTYAQQLSRGVVPRSVSDDRH